ncbi:hypothetical protein [Oribacterium sp. WCC10]|uniref:hypothetical protein n=1 Tax=Oribacterium sp. WCC10 TaxID=1855343 RepID=UPI0008F0DCA8|nr:hypothetical protein [Oribacterium sp. WCC10]SFG15906.1 hypothetical protein SAMN05216356_102217 [Oribacterium sp. WCC10]
MNLLIEKIELYKEKTRGRRIKSVKFRFPVYYDGDMVEEIDLGAYEVKPTNYINTSIEDQKSKKSKSDKEKNNLPLKDKHVETCCLLERLRNAKDYIPLKLDMEEYYKIKDAEKK